MVAILIIVWLVLGLFAESTGNEDLLFICNSPFELLKIIAILVVAIFIKVIADAIIESSEGSDKDSKKAISHIVFAIILIVCIILIIPILSRLAELLGIVVAIVIIFVILLLISIFK